MGLFRRKYTSTSDEQLLILFKQGNEQSVLEELYVRYAHLIMGTAIKYTNQLADAEDIVSHVFEVLPSKLRSHDIANFRPWLHMVTKNECLMKLRKTTKEIPQELVEANAEVDGYDNQTDDQIELTLQSINDLKEPQQSCIRMFYLENRSYAEISEMLALDMKTVKSAIQNGKRNIKLQLIHRDEFKEPKI